MVLLKKVNFDNPTYPSASYISDWYNLEASKYIIYSVYCSEDCTLRVNWAFDNQYEITDTDELNLTGGTSQELVLLSKNLFARFEVDAIASTPSDLKVQVLFFV